MKSNEKCKKTTTGYLWGVLGPDHGEPGAREGADGSLNIIGTAIIVSSYMVDAGNRTGRQDTSSSDARFGPLELRIRPMGFPAMPVRFPVLKVDSDNQNDQFLMILVRP